jgi:sugar fermentation stimulation protein A
MRIDLPVLEGKFLRRYKRFFTDVELPDGSVVVAHCPNTGSLKTCLEEGRPAILRDTQDPERKLRHVFQSIRVGKTWVNVDTSLPNQATYEHVVAGQIPELKGYAEAKREVKYGVNSRIDLLLTGAKGERCWVEVKNTTYALDGAAAFPDAVTERGRKHLEELAAQVRLGDRAVQFFFVSRDDVTRFRPAQEIDPDYAAALRVAAKAGVELLAYAHSVTPNSLEVARRLPIDLD